MLTPCDPVLKAADSASAAAAASLSLIPDQSLRTQTGRRGRCRWRTLRKEKKNYNTSKRVLDTPSQWRRALITCAVRWGQRGWIPSHPLARQSLSGDGDGGGRQGLGALGVIYSLVLERTEEPFRTEEQNTAAWVREAQVCLNCRTVALTGVCVSTVFERTRLVTFH